MNATDFGRNDCIIDGKLKSYATIRRDYCCAACGGIPVVFWTGEGYMIACGRCHATDFMTHNQYARRRADAIEVLAGLPAELAETLSGG